MAILTEITRAQAALTYGELIATVVLAVLLAWLSISDVRHYRIPDAASLPLVIIGILCSHWLVITTPSDAVVGAVFGYAVFAGLGYGFFRLTGEDGLGLGDAKLLAAAGAWLGWRDLPVLIVLAAVSALVFALALRTRKIPFGPWLAAVFWVLWILRVSS